MNTIDVTGHPFVLTVERILAMQAKMTDVEKRALAEWERDHLGQGDKGTTDWPGWRDVYARLSH